MLAPGGLALVQEFVNSVDLESRDDDLENATSAQAWLGRHEVALRSPLDEESRRRLVDVRERLRDLLEAHSSEAVDPSVASSLEHLLGGAVLRPVVSSSGVALAPADAGVDGFLATLVQAIVEAGVVGTWERLKVCRDDVCREAFYDHSKNGRGAWCSMRVCGNRAKARAYRARRISAATPAAG